MSIIGRIQQDESLHASIELLRMYLEQCTVLEHQIYEKTCEIFVKLLKL